MKKLQLLIICVLLTLLNSCRAIGDIFKAGVGVGIFIVIAIVGVIIFIIAKSAGGGK